MKWFNVFIRYRLWIGLAFLVGAILVNITSGFWPSLALYIIAVLMIFTHFFFGPLRLLQEELEDGNFEGAEKILRISGSPTCSISPSALYIIP